MTTAEQLRAWRVVNPEKRTAQVVAYRVQQRENSRVFREENREHFNDYQRATALQLSRGRQFGLIMRKSERYIEQPLSSGGVWIMKYHCTAKL